jgi:hypothetical protein
MIHTCGKYQGETSLNNQNILKKMKDSKVKQVLSGGGYLLEGEGKWIG